MERVTTPFDARSTAIEVLTGVDLRGQRAIVTGGASGIGIETTRALASAGAAVTVAVRRPDAALPVVAGLRSTVAKADIDVRLLDLADLCSVSAFVRNWHGPLHMLVNNAGVMAVPTLMRTAQGWELQFATNFLGHFALAAGLHPALAAARGARVVSVSSSANLMGPVQFDDPHFRFIPYDPWLAYAQAKTANILFAVAAASRWKDVGICVNALNPGAILTQLQRHVGGALRTPPERQKSVAQGAATSVLLAASPHLRNVSGRHFEDCNEALMVPERPSDFSGGVAPYALAVENAERLWQLGEALAR
jgi:NAD(P)-dependent dehydrogenase (short-subunit alcohol dehydrogenase family)